ncbi:MAG: hypothetical protein CL916_14000 [Deltaproteobacteria bacterium]|nr:hypothetical protein [Deltaproteobacteria bacterium]
MSWDDIIGFGVAGNMAGHLEQAGEDRDFVSVSVLDRKAPKGMFPFYLPHSTIEHQLHVMPLSDSIIEIKPDGENYQIEPEVSLLCSLEYKNGCVVSITPHYAMAHNDCSIRKEGAKKISEKKNWGANTKGVSAQRIEIDSFASGGILDHYQLTSYLLRAGTLHHYGISSPLTTYSYFYEELIDWMVDRFAYQEDVGPLENLQEHLATSGYPKQALISIGATRYTDFGASNYLQPGDVSIVVVYDRRKYSEADIQELIQEETHECSDVSILKQRVILQANS